MYGRFARGLRSFLKNPPKLSAARAAVNANLANREKNFLRIVKVGVYGLPRSPYLALLRHAGITLEDIERMVESEGLDGTLRILHEGVYSRSRNSKGAFLSSDRVFIRCKRSRFRQSAPPQLLRRADQRIDGELGRESPWISITLPGLSTSASSIST